MLRFALECSLILLDPRDFLHYIVSFLSPIFSFAWGQANFKYGVGIHIACSCLFLSCIKKIRKSNKNAYLFLFLFLSALDYPYLTWLEIWILLS